MDRVAPWLTMALTAEPKQELAAEPELGVAAAKLRAEPGVAAAKLRAEPATGCCGWVGGVSGLGSSP
jgi:hypothetical protein